MPRPVHFEIHASQPEAIRAFYSALFGWTFHQWGEQAYWLLGTGDGNPMAGIPSSEPGIDGALVPRSGPVAQESQPVNSWVVTVDVDDCQAYLDRAIELGATVALPLAPIPGVGWLAYIKDPDGNLLGMMQSDPDAGPSSPTEAGEAPAMTTASQDLADIYRDLHAHPELGFQEHRTAGIVAEHLSRFGFEVTTGVGRTGVVGILRNGEGPTALLRADMDGLPVAEETGLPYASTDVAPGESGDLPVMHACGHDMHVTALLGAAKRLADETDSWAGTLMLVFQPAEELGAGAQAMIDDGLFERFGRPDVVLGQHVAPMPAGVIGLRSGPAFAAADALRIVLHGRGAHGSRPEASVDPVVMAAATVMRLQTVVSREVGGSETAVVSVGVMRAGTAVNIIPDTAELLVSVRTFTRDVRDRVVEAIGRIARAEAAASGAAEPPDVEVTSSFPAVSNDPAAVDRTRPALQALPAMVVDPGPVTGSEDVGMLATAAGAPCVFWLLGGADPAAFEGAASFEEMALRVAALPSNHSPLYAPVIEPTLTIGVNALVAAAHTWLPRAEGR